MKEEQYMGLSKKSAQNLAEAQNLLFRLISIDDEPFMDYPSDVRNDRICVEIKSGKVVKVKFC